ncbi:Zn-dependent hydrolase [Rhodoligotrophos appendicifer]|uniref:Zn-dependent hydrolase n=1 Tax=Rhodoligotrophos appendicifer TaxID=987056 RepID=UPI002482A4F5|nr:Zn-dependent hydrolase [Rhodoligotrophos appendicifer]
MASGKWLRPDRLQADLVTLASFGGLANGGVTRPAFSQAYREAVVWLRTQMNDAGLTVSTDAVGNLIGRLGPAEGPAVICGSHIDSVLEGGRYDGALGVLAGLECARALTANGQVPARALEVVAFVDEEGAFLSLLGSRAMTGRLQKSDIVRAAASDGTRLVDVMETSGLDSRQAAWARRPPEDFNCMVELHIEQGPVLESALLDIGIVTSVVGLHLSRLTFSGQAAHAGTTPLDTRRDAMRGAAEAITRAFEALERDFGPDVRLTFGALNVLPGSSNVVPGLVVMTCEIRAESEQTILELARDVELICRDVAAHRGLGFRRQLLSYDPPTAMSARIIDVLARVAGELSFSHHLMPSGAGHDAQSFADVCPTGIIFVPSQNGLSHNPFEFTAPEYIERGLRLLHAFLCHRLFASA